MVDTVWYRLFVIQLERLEASSRRVAASTNKTIVIHCHVSVFNVSSGGDAACGGLLQGR